MHPPVVEYQMALLHQAELRRAADRHRLGTPDRRVGPPRRVLSLRNLLIRWTPRRPREIAEAVPCRP